MKKPTLLALVGLSASLAAYQNRESLTEITESQEETKITEVEERNNPWDHLQLKGFHEYNKLLPILYQASKKHSLPLEYLAIIALTETNGQSKITFEPTFFKRYLRNPSTEVRKKINKWYREAKKQTPNLRYTQFMRQLATSTGLLQRIYIGALEAGFKGTLKELSKPENNAEFVAQYLHTRGITYQSSLEETLRLHNTGSRKGTPRKGYLKRAKHYADKLQIQYTR